MAIIALCFSQAAMHTLSHMRFSQVKLEIHEWQAAIQLHKLVELTFPIRNLAVQFIQYGCDMMWICVYSVYWM